MATQTHTSVYVNFESLPSPPDNLQEHNVLLQGNVSDALAQTSDPLGLLLTSAIFLVITGLVLFGLGLSLRCKESLSPGIMTKRSTMSYQRFNKALGFGIAFLLICFVSLFIHSNAWAAEQSAPSPREVVEQKMPPYGVFRITYLPYGDDISSRPLNRKLVTLIPKLAEKDAALFIESTSNGAYRVKSLSTNQYFDAPFDPTGSIEPNIEYNRTYKPQTGQWIFSWNSKIKAWRIHNFAWGSKAYLRTIGGGSSGFDYYCLLNQSNKNEPKDSHLWRLTEIPLSGTATITGNTKPGSTLTCETQITSYKPGKKGFRWYASSDPNKKGELISDTPPGSLNATTLTIPESYAGLYITCEVYSDTYRGKIVSNTVYIKTDKLNADAQITGSYEYGSNDGLHCKVTGLPTDYVPEYTWFRGEKPGDLTTMIGTGDRHRIDKNDVGFYLNCKVTDSSGKYPDVFIAQGDKAFARISITAPLLIEGTVTGDGSFNVPPLLVTNESLCDVNIYEIRMNRKNTSSLSCALNARDTLLFEGVYGGRIPSNVMLSSNESLPFRLSLKGSLSNADEQQLTQHGSFNLGSLTFCAKL